MLRFGPFNKFFSKPGVGLASDFPTTLDNLELYLDSRSFCNCGWTDGTEIGIAGVTPWEDLSGQTQGAARDGIQGTQARRPLLQLTTQYISPKGEPTIRFLSETAQAISPNPFKQLASANPSGAGNPWDIVNRGHTFLFGGRFYSQSAQAVLWADVADNRCQLYPQFGPDGNVTAPQLRTNAGSFHSLNTAAIFPTDPLPWSVFVLRFNPPKDTNGQVDFLRWDYDSDWITYSPAATVQWDTGGAVGWKLSGNASFNVPQNMDLSWVLWYSDVLTQEELDFLVLWNNIYFGHD